MSGHNHHHLTYYCTNSVHTEREREREMEREIEREKQRQTERQKERDRKTDRVREREIDGYEEKSRGRES